MIVKNAILIIERAIANIMVTIWQYTAPCWNMRNMYQNYPARITSWLQTEYYPSELIRYVYCHYDPLPTTSHAQNACLNMFDSYTANGKQRLQYILHAFHQKEKLNVPFAKFLFIIIYLVWYTDKLFKSIIPKSCKPSHKG